MRFISFSAMLELKEFLAKINNLHSHQGAGPNAAASVALA